MFDGDEKIGFKQLAVGAVSKNLGHGVTYCEKNTTIGAVIERTADDFPLVWVETASLASRSLCCEFPAPDGCSFAGKLGKRNSRRTKRDRGQLIVHRSQGRPKQEEYRFSQ